jgi:hypothetical protein
MFDTSASSTVDRSVYAFHSSGDVANLSPSVMHNHPPSTAFRASPHLSTLILLPHTAFLLPRRRRSRRPRRDLPGAAAVERRSAPTLLGLFSCRYEFLLQMQFLFLYRQRSILGLRLFSPQTVNLAQTCLFDARWFTFSRFLGHQFT